ncbi:DUF2835 domain-containing protein [Photobacterium nomapromontoriensis]|uniref:DUF2835 domain-containing protein n=1 Tax=Photobacterium nomapromontoriensis TaxID=2910237 RepID=UPI003D143B79
MKSYTFSIYISYQHFLNHYSGAASTVLVETDSGLKLQFPATRLRPFLSQMGIKGRFRVLVSQENRFHAIERVS